MNLVRLLCAASLLLSVLCNSAAAQLSNNAVDVNGVAREYLLYVPAGYDGSTDLPVLFVYHGGDMTSQAMLLLVDFRPLADSEGFLLVYPQGLPDDEGSAIWNSVGPFSNGVDEIGFTSVMIDDLAANHAVDLSRVYACGYSNGANLCWELGCFLSDRIAAVGAVAGSMWEWTEDLCTPSRPVPVVSVHGTFDFFNPYSGGPPFSLGLIAASQYWVQVANASPTPAVENVPNTVPGDGSTAVHLTWSGGDGCVDIEHYRVVNGGHDWPGVFGNMDIDASEIIWEFVSQYDLNGEIGCSTCSVVQLGVGVGGANIGTLDSPTTPSLGSNLQFDWSGFNGPSAGLLILSLEDLTTPLLGGTIFLDFAVPAATFPASIDANGTGSLGFTLGTNPALAGLVTYSQVGIFDPSQAFDWAFSNGLEITFCQ